MSSARFAARVCSAILVAMLVAAGSAIAKPADLPTRGGNTASILPNDSLHARRYGRVIMLRDNIYALYRYAALGE